MDHLKAKVEAGADYIVTQLFFDNRDFLDFRERCALAGINVPIIAGIMPITSMSGFKRIAELAGGARFPRNYCARCSVAKTIRRWLVAWAFTSRWSSATIFSITKLPVFIFTHSIARTRRASFSTVSASRGDKALRFLSASKKRMQQDAAKAVREIAEERFKSPSEILVSCIPPCPLRSHRRISLEGGAAELISRY